jgi:hypothetical protein
MLREELAQLHAFQQLIKYGQRTDVEGGNRFPIAASRSLSAAQALRPPRLRLRTASLLVWHDLFLLEVPRMRGSVCRKNLVCQVSGEVFARDIYRVKR